MNTGTPTTNTSPLNASYAYGTAAPGFAFTPTNLPAGTTTTTTVVDTTQGKPSFVKGEMNVLMGKVTGNKEKQIQGITMLAATKEDKAARYETKAIEWDGKGNTQKAAKNRAKAARLREQAVTKLTNLPGAVNTAPHTMGGGYAPGFPGTTVSGTNTNTNHKDKAAKYDAKALEYQRKNNPAKAQKNREKAIKKREKQLNKGMPTTTTTTTAYPTV